jgi:hypothetical protein
MCLKNEYFEFLELVEVGVVLSNSQQLAPSVGQRIERIKEPWVQSRILREFSEKILNCGK